MSIEDNQRPARRPSTFRKDENVEKICVLVYEDKMYNIDEIS